MAKPGELDWSDLHAGKVGEPEHPLSKPVTTGPVLRKGEVPRRPTDAEIRAVIMSGAPRQPTDEELFGGGVVTEEMAKARQEEWNSQFTKFFRTKHPPVEKSHPQEWGSRGPVNQRDESQLTEEEQRIRQIPVDPSLLSD